MHEPEPHPSPESLRPGHAPRIWAASLSDYNAGVLHGAWIDAARDPDDIDADIAAMLAASHQRGAEEWAIHDCEDFGPVRLGEYESIIDVSRIALGITEHGMAYAAWVAHHGEHPDDDFEDCFLGEWDSLQDYAQHYADDTNLDRLLQECVPGYLLAYVAFDAAAFGRDLELGGDIFTADTPDGGIWVFYAH
ncbi:MAG: antirestriction protein ArdA [Ilumatobacter sp.]|uniref:antirestriction protein ArdA n=1 Tax=Ilumatobacter sp. TaxID=1967498 RepID=UPI00262B3906|nr:antirestriction protein ArdA [Ilumatobacter sp.]MDJ0769421.1 antirestriction protein ArdA [Ilumatobacter sp.]